MKIILGSKSQEKLNIAKTAFKQLYVDTQVHAEEVASGITGQPLDKETTKLGAINRAKHVLDNHSDIDFALGLEGGLHQYDDGYHLITFACLIDKQGASFIGSGEEIHLPKEVSEKVKAGGWFGDVIREYAEDNPIDDDLVSHLTPFTQAIQNAYANFLKAKGDLKYRQGTIGIVIDSKNNFLITQLDGYGDNDWRFPGGGVDEGETPEETILRELKEELGTDQFKILKKSKLTIKYDWPEHVIVKRLIKERKTYRGQIQTQFLIKFTGDTEDIKPDPVEIKKLNWVRYDELKDRFNFPNQWDEASKVLDDLLPNI
jgi:inosine/xanthosine triphosphatase